jgi:predicted nucleic acid-binding protein
VILADSSVWIDHWRRGGAAMSTALGKGEVAIHAFVIGELACGSMPKASTTLALLNQLPRVPAARHDEVMRLVGAHRLAGSGIGWVDAHLLAAASLARVPLWTLDRALKRVAERLDVFGEPEV